MSKLLELAERCEKAVAPDRRLDVEIAVEMDWRWDDWEDGESTARGQAERHGLDWLIGRALTGTNSMWRGIPRYTASLDAAMTLKPDSCWGDCGNRHDGTGYAELCGSVCASATGATPALALCAAALRARASQEDQSLTVGG